MAGPDDDSEKSHEATQHKLAEARKKGVLRQEGKTYTVQDGDIMNILFNV